MKNVLQGWLERWCCVTEESLSLSDFGQGSLVLGWKLSQGCELDTLVSLHVGLLGLPFSMVAGF